MFKAKMSPVEPEYVNHFDDMTNVNGGDQTMWRYHDDIIAKDKRVAYSNPNYPWIVAAYQYQNYVSRPPAVTRAASHASHSRKTRHCPYISARTHTT